MIITLFSKILGFVREIIMSYYYGAGNITDAYLVSITIPTVIFGFFGTAISTGYIPMFSQIERLEGDEKSLEFTNNLINLLLLLSTGVFVLSFIFAKELVKVFASGFTGETLDMAVNFSRISLVGIYFTGLISIFSGFLQIKGNFAVPALVGFPLNLIIISAIILSSRGNIYILAIGTLLATISQFAVVGYSAYKEGLRYRFKTNIQDPYIKKMVRIALPVVLGVSVNHINVLVDRTLASKLVEGGISALNYAGRLNIFIDSIFVLSITTALYPLMSKMVAEEDMTGLKAVVAEAMNTISLLVLPATVGAMIFAQPIVSLLFGRGQFGESALQLTTAAFYYYSIGMIGYGLRQALSRTFYALQDTKTPAINGAIAVGINIVLNIILSKYMGIGGLALATSISALLCTGLLLINLRKRIGTFDYGAILKTFIKITLASLFMGGMAKLTFIKLSSLISPHIALILSVALGALVYFVLIYFAGIPEVDSLLEAIRRKLGPKKTSH